VNTSELTPAFTGKALESNQFLERRIVMEIQPGLLPALIVFFVVVAVVLIAQLIIQQRKK
jgi:hypothetical protein